MLPRIRSKEYLYPIPEYDLKPSDVKNFIQELKGFHEIFEDCFHRRESRNHFFNYMTGQFSNLQRKSIEPIALNSKNSKVRSMQRFISDAEWDDSKINKNYCNLINEDMGHPDGVVIFDESGFQKKGNNSIGVYKQYCGNLGKVDNCQVGVFASYASTEGYALIDKRLYIPKIWFSDEYKEKRSKCKLPNTISFKTKPQLAIEMLNSITDQNILPFGYVLADTVYGSNPDFIEAIEQKPDLTYFVSVPSDKKCWLKNTFVSKKKDDHKNKIKTKENFKKYQEKPIKLIDLARNINKFFWYKRKVSEGSKGPIEYEFSRKKVIMSKNGRPDRNVWLIIKRTLDKNPIYSFFISNASGDTKLPTFVWLSGLRWSIEQCFKETKSELGMDHYEVRKYPGWNHHIQTCMLAHFFLWHLKIRLGEKNTIYYSLAN